MYYVYILLCSDNRTYIGCTDDLKDRLNRHNNSYVPATKDRLPVKLFSYFAKILLKRNLNFEKYLKSGSGRAFLKKHKMI